ncbi:glycogen debranching protein GlgX [Pseudactinotalea sp. Z1748]|uniref:glycogen debranching protein GlgX n=1 Tax=Pseudactinotalea sp. Z1748 TaxID=3413027 RepID=UPI003C7D040C
MTEARSTEVVDAGTVTSLAARRERLGAHLVPGGLDVVVHAPHATQVQVCLLDVAAGSLRERRYWLVPGTHGRWSGHVPGVVAGQRYGLRVHGPWDLAHGYRHNPSKLLLDPYARAVTGEVDLVPQIYGGVVDEHLEPVSDEPDGRDSAPYVPHGVVVAEPEVVEHRPRLWWSETVIYEAHVKGLTMQLHGVPEELRGTYAGLAHPATIAHLRGLGITAVELLPIFAKATEPALRRRGAVNYWGYNTLAFFAPEPSYATAAARAAGPAAVIQEVRAMVESLHEAGLEVLLDVVYNHTAEGGVDGPMLSWRGLDNAGYYLHTTSTHGRYLDVTGTGNSVDFRSQHAVAMAIDSMRYWVERIGVDGFRLDLAVTLGRNGTEFDPRHPLLVAMAIDPVLAGVKQIAEPWDVGPHGWRTGQFAAPMAEWNDRFRDVTRSFWLSDVASIRSGGKGQDLRDLATRLAGSADLFAHTGIPGGRGPTSSVNYVTAHDGFTLADLTSYDVKHNWRNGEDNRDGSDHNHSYNHGAEGPTEDAEIQTARRRSIRALLGTLLVSAGTPMLTAGDEIGRTQNGNNNAYARDDASVWVDWNTEPWQQDLLATTAHLLALRREHRALRTDRYMTFTSGAYDWSALVAWFDGNGSAMELDVWHDADQRILQMLRHPPEPGAAQALVLFNGTLAQAEVPLAGPHDVSLVWDSAWERPGPAGPVLPPGSAVRIVPLSMQIYLSGPLP